MRRLLSEKIVSKVIRLINEDKSHDEITDKICRLLKATYKCHVTYDCYSDKIYFDTQDIPFEEKDYDDYDRYKSIDFRIKKRRIGRFDYDLGYGVDYLGNYAGNNVLLYGMRDDGSDREHNLGVDLNDNWVSKMRDVVSGIVVNEFNPK